MDPLLYQNKIVRKLELLSNNNNNINNINININININKMNVVSNQCQLILQLKYFDPDEKDFDQSCREIEVEIKWNIKCPSTCPRIKRV